MNKIKAYAAQSAKSPLAPFEIQRREPGPDDVRIEILYCGVCHSDLHTARNEWKNTQYPCVPGHEIVGRVTAVGGKVTRFKVGDIAAVGCMVDSCGHCHSCGEGEEQYCENGFTGAYNGPLFGGIRETQEMLDFCAERGIVSDIELIGMDYINTAYERMLKSDVKYRFVIDMASFDD